MWNVKMTFTEGKKTFFCHTKLVQWFIYIFRTTFHIITIDHSSSCSNIWLPKKILQLLWLEHSTSRFQVWNSSVWRSPRWAKAAIRKPTPGFEPGILWLEVKSDNHFATQAYLMGLQMVYFSTPNRNFNESHILIQ